MKKKLLIIGVNSLLYEIFRLSNFKNYDAISHKEVNNINYDNYEVFLLLSFDPNLHKSEINISNSIENSICKKIISYNKHLIYMSSSRVYENNEAIDLHEELDIDKSKLTNYGFNKKVIEDYFLEMLNDRCTILRLSNILHSKKYCYNKKSFMCTFYKNLSNGFIKMPSNSFKKDFMIENDFITVLSNIIENYNTFPGIYNFGSGKYLTNENFINTANSSGVSKLIYGDKTFSFFLNVKKITSQINIKFNQDILIKTLKNLSQQK